MVWSLARRLGLSSSLLAALVAALLVVLRQSGAESPESLPRSAGAAELRVEIVSLSERRSIRQVSLYDPALGPISFAVSLPHPLPDRPLPIIVLLGGIGKGIDALRYMPPIGENAVLSYDWPIPQDLPDGIDLLWESPGLYRQIFKVPGQIDAAVAWAVEQPWAERERVTILSFSLGAVAAPAAQRLREARGGAVGWTVLAYGGADLGKLLASHPEVPLDALRPPLGWLADWLFNPLEPAEHLPSLTGKFLIVGAQEDSLIPEKSARLMRELAPEPKSFALLSGAHIGVGGGQEALRQRILDVTEAWLLKQKAINPRVPTTPVQDPAP